MQFLRAYDALLQKSPILTKTLTSAALFGLGDAIAQKLEGGDTFDSARFVRLVTWGAAFAPLAHGWYGILDKAVPGVGGSVVARKVIADQLVWTPPVNCLFFWMTTTMATGDSGAGIVAIQEKLWPTLKVGVLRGGWRRSAPCSSAGGGWSVVGLPTHNFLTLSPSPFPTCAGQLGGVAGEWGWWGGGAGGGGARARRGAGVGSVSPPLLSPQVLQAINMSMVPVQYRILYVNVASIGWSAFLSKQAAAKPLA